MRTKNPEYLYYDSSNETWVGSVNGQRKYSKNKGKVEEWIKEQKILAKREGQQAIEFPMEERLDALRALEIIRPHGKTLQDAATFLADHLSGTEKP